MRFATQNEHFHLIILDLISDYQCSGNLGTFQLTTHTLTVKRNGCKDLSACDERIPEIRHTRTGSSIIAV